MLDGHLRPKIDPILKAIATRLVSLGVTANATTIAGFLIGLLAAVAIVYSAFWLALFLIIVSRLCDGLDGSIARINGTSDFGGYLDITLDFAFYGAIPLAFIMVDPGANAIAGAVLLFSFYFNGASFLAFSIIAEKRGLKTDQRGEKSIFFTTGLAEATETIAVFVAFCLFPQWFAPIAWVFAVVCFYTTLSRIMLARELFTQ